MSANILFDIQLTWECCPPELLRIIFKELDSRSLLNLMTVNRRWKDVVVDYIEFYGLWQKIAKEQMLNMGVTFEKKSILGWKDMLINSMLWSSVSSAQVKLHHTYNIDNIKIMHMYKDKLIVKTQENVKYINVTNSQLIRLHESPCKEIDFSENDHIIVVFLQNEKCKELCLYGKETSDDFSFNENFMYTIDYVLCYRLEENTCYIVTDKFIVWALIWNRKKWRLKLIGRYYGGLYDNIGSIHVYKNQVSMVTKYGFILCEDAKSKKFDKVAIYSLDRPYEASNWLLFNRSDVAFSVNRQDPRIYVGYDLEYDHLRLECADMTCAIEHGEVIFLGFKDGVVAICRPKSMLENKGGPDMYLHVKDFDYTITDPKVVALEVFEDKLCHHLIIATSHKIIHLLLTYPFNIRTYYE